MAKLPSREDLEKLPRRSIVAYAVRAARRVQPLFEWGADREDHQKHSQKINTAVTLSQRWANGENFSLKELKSAHEDIFNTSYDSVLTVINANSKKSKIFNSINYATTYAAAQSADSILLATIITSRYVNLKKSLELKAKEVGAHPSRVEEILAYQNVADYAVYTVNAASLDSPHDDDVYTANTTIPAINDYQKLLSLNLSVEDPIDASENGPLGPYWPEELEPDWYKELYPKMRALLDERVEE